MNSALITAWLSAHQRHCQQERHAKRPLKLQRGKPETFLAPFAISKRPRIMMGECIGHRRLKSRSASKNSWKRVSRRLGSLVLGSILTAWAFAGRVIIVTHILRPGDWREVLWTLKR